MNENKKMLREKLRLMYACMSENECASIDRLMMQRLMQEAFFCECSRVFLYASVGDEIETRKLIETLFRQGKTIALPKCEDNGIMHFYKYEGSLAAGRYGIPEPTGTEILCPMPNDIMIVPGMAFDEKGDRLGRGGGYYDRYLEKYRCITVGLCRNRMLQKKIPTEWNDLPVDYVITESSTIRCKQNGASEEAP